MARATSGYLSEDGTFFETEAEADLHTAEMKIIAYCVSHTPKPIDSDKLLAAIEALAAPIKEYLNAKDRLEAPKNDWNREVDEWADRISPSAKTEEDQADKDESGEGIDAVLEQSVDGHEPMSNVGDGSQSEGILNKRKSHGFRGWKRDA